MDYVRMGQMLRQRRLECGLSQEQLADMARISPEMCDRIERGACRVELETLVRLAEALRLSVDMLVELKGRFLYRE